MPLGMEKQNMSKWRELQENIGTSRIVKKKLNKYFKNKNKICIYKPVSVLVDILL